MRPTIDEQLAGARRLLDLVAADPGLSPASAELLRNADRLLRRVGTSWATTLPFLVEDNATLTDLLARLAPLLPAPAATATPAATTAPDPVAVARPDLDVAVVAARNTELRALLARAVRELPRTPAGATARAEIGDYLTRRVESDPT
jgi:hypothetical protein